MKNTLSNNCVYMYNYETQLFLTLICFKKKLYHADIHTIELKILIREINKKYMLQILHIV